MSSAVVNSDADLLELLRVTGPLDVSEMAGAIEVTATAVRQRLGRMMARQLIQRDAIRKGRGGAQSTVTSSPTGAGAHRVEFHRPGHGIMARDQLGR